MSTPSPAMAAAPSRSPGPLANKVCLNCKLRKKKCDKALPSCGYCAEKGYRCQYHHDSTHYAGALLHPNSFVHSPFSEASSTEAALCHEAKRIINSTGQYLDEISVRYFQGVHCYLPIISRQRFHGLLLSFSTELRADFSILLLTMCLLTYYPSLSRQDFKLIEPTALYLATKSLLSQALTLGKPSLTLVQAAFLLSVFEYARGEAEQAFISVGGAARMAYAANLKRPVSLPARVSAESEVHALDEEHSNTWWAISMGERTFLCELGLVHQPLLSVIPQGLVREESLLESCQGPSVPSRAVTVYLDGFRQAALGVCLLDQLHSILQAPGREPNVAHLNDLDRTVQSFLTTTMQRYPVASGVHCGGITLSIRALFVIHRTILNLLKVPSSQFEYPKDAYGTSKSALDTATKIVADVAESRQHLAPDQMDALPPTYIYLAWAALSYIDDECKPLAPGSWICPAERKLQNSIDGLYGRWNGRPVHTPPKPF